MKNARHSNLIYQGWNDEPPGWNDELWECLYNFFLNLSYDILVCSNVFYNIFYICNEVLMWY